MMKLKAKKLQENGQRKNIKNLQNKDQNEQNIREIVIDDLN